MLYTAMTFHALHASGATTTSYPILSYNKQRFEVTMVAPNCAPLLLNLAHDQLGHNGSARTYMLLKRIYYWKGMKTDIYNYVKQCKLCQK